MAYSTQFLRCIRKSLYSSQGLLQSLLSSEVKSTVIDLGIKIRNTTDSNHTGVAELGKIFFKVYIQLFLASQILTMVVFTGNKESA